MKKILFLLVLTLSFVSCSEDESFQSASNPVTTRGDVPGTAFTNIEWYSSDMIEEISGDVTCTAASNVNFKMVFSSDYQKNASCTLIFNNKSYNYNSPIIVNNLTVNLPEGTSRISVRLTRIDYSRPVYATAKMIITGISGGSIVGSPDGYGDLVAFMYK